MPINYEELLNAIAEVCDDRNLKAAVTGNLKGGLIAGTSAIIGGLLFGPVGLALGGSIGGVTAAATAKGTFKPVSQIIKQMPPGKREQLCLRVKKAFQDFGVQDVMTLASLLLSQSSLQELAIREVTNYFQNNLSMAVKSG